MTQVDGDGMSEEDIWSVLYDVQEQLKTSKDKPLEYEYPPSFSFSSPELIIKNGESNGRGYYASHDLQPGTLLLLEIPIAHVYDSVVEEQYSEVYGATTALLTMNVLNLLAESPEVVDLIAPLHPQASDYDHAKHEVEIEDNALLQSLKTTLQNFDENVLSLDLKKRLSALIRYNQIAFYTNNEQLCFQTHYKQTSGTGLYIKASMFNHNCSPNAVYYTIDRALLVYVAREIKAGEEICISYIESSCLVDSALFRNVHIDRDFICGCEKCTDQLQWYDIKLINDPNAIDSRMGEVLSEGIMEELWKMPAFERMGFASEIKSAEESNFKMKDHIEYSMLFAISYEECVIWEKSYWFWEASIKACSVHDHDELVKHAHAALAALALGNQNRFRQYLKSFLEKHDRYCGGGFRNLRLRYDEEISLHPIGPKLKQLFWKFAEKLYPAKI